MLQYLIWSLHSKYLERECFCKGKFARATKHFFCNVSCCLLCYFFNICFPPCRTNIQHFSVFKKRAKIKIVLSFALFLEANKYRLLSCEEEYQKSRTHKIKASLSHTYIHSKPRSSLQQLREVVHVQPIVHLHQHFSSSWELLKDHCSPHSDATTEPMNQIPLRWSIPRDTLLNIQCNPATNGLSIHRTRIEPAKRKTLEKL